MGTITVRFSGKWFIFDYKTKLFVNGTLHSTHSTKKGFNVSIPIQSDNIILKLVLGGMKSTTYELQELEKNKNYVMELTYSELWGRYSTKFNLWENG